MPPLKFDQFRTLFDKKIEEYALTWEVIGFQSPDGRVYPFGTDTKVISTVFETLAGPIISEIAETFGYVVEGSEQTVYPDFTLSPVDRDLPRIAIDIKTTYRRFQKDGTVAPFRYTLGSYTSFLRTPGAAKNIKFPYEEYSDHWIIGFLYTRRPNVHAKVHYRSEEAGDNECPYLDVEYFLQEKFKIVGLSPASGNTTNIGSFATRDLEDLRNGGGPFSELGKEVCDQYWRYYAAKRANRAYSNVEEFLAWQKQMEADAVED